MKHNIDHAFINAQTIYPFYRETLFISIDARYNTETLLLRYTGVYGKFKYSHQFPLKFINFSYTCIYNKKSWKKQNKINSCSIAETTNYFITN